MFINNHNKIINLIILISRYLLSYDI